MVGHHSFFYFLDGYSGYHQIPIYHDDQSKMTFTCTQPSMSTTLKETNIKTSPLKNRFF
jgi:hypothetical protein